MNESVWSILSFHLMDLLTAEWWFHGSQFVNVPTKTLLPLLLFDRIGLKAKFQKIVWVGVDEHLWKDDESSMGSRRTTHRSN